MTEIESVREFVRIERERYEEIARRVHKACEDIKAELGGDVVTRVYSRSTKQRSELKDTEKIFAACKRPVNITNLKAIEDIIGLTIVVQYPDQVENVLNKVLAKLKAHAIKQVGKRKVHTATYFATHMVLISHEPGYEGLKCEVQCKTMLHDAWSTKMHDLTYKPQGSLDDRMKSLIETISGTIEGLEQQSQIVRGMIQARQSIERRPFQASLDELYKGLSEALAGDWKEGLANQNLQNLRRRLHEGQVHLRACSASDPVLDKLARDIQSAAADPKQLRGAWLLAVRLAGFRSEPKFGAYLNDQIQRVMDVMTTWRSRGDFTDREITAIPIGFYVIEDFTRALEYTDLILARATDLKLPEFRCTVLRLNKLLWLLERESLRPSKADKRKDLLESIDKNLKEICEQIDKNVEDAAKQSDEVEFKKKDEFKKLRPSYRDAAGLLNIVFGTTKEQVRKGIDECVSALTENSAPEEAEVDTAYAEWRTQVGWRRYFDLAEDALERAIT